MSASGIGEGTIVRRDDEGQYTCVTDAVVIEEPLEIRIGARPLAVTMRTPGHDEELAAGFLLSEAVVRHRDDLRSIVPSASGGATGNILDVTLAPHIRLDRRKWLRHGTIGSSCGLCGKQSIAGILQHFPPVPSSVPAVSAAQLLALPDLVRAAQRNFDRTGGLHAAALFDLDTGAITVREDIGRHNAVDKVIGRALLDDALPLRRHLLFVSGRASLEIVQKALSAGIGIVAAVSAPSSLAINFARDAGQTLVGFLRPPTFNIYSHAERLVP